MRYSVSLLASAAIVAISEATTLRVDVGLNGLKFTPNNTVAAVGDVVEFHFHPKNHSVVQSSFNSPCNFASISNPIFSGFMPVSSGEGPSVFQVTVTNTTPIWLYCGQVSHCQTGMVAAINAPEIGNTLAAYAAKALGTSTSTNPKTVEGGIVVQDTSNSTSASTSTVSSPAGSMPTYGGAAPSASGSATSSAAAATTSKAGAVSLKAVSWNELLGMGVLVGGAAILMQ